MDFLNDRQILGLSASTFFAVCLVMAVLVVTAVAFPEGAAAILVVFVTASAFLLIFRTTTDEKEFVTNVFLLALLLRLGFGIFVHVYDLRDFFGGDAITYDFRGNILRDAWLGSAVISDQTYRSVSSTSGSGWGMYYLVAALYTVVGRNILAAQSFCAVVGAATAPMVFICTRRIYSNLQASKTAAILIAVFPAFIIWSSQLLKDGLIIFLLVLVMTMVIELQSRFSLPALLLLGLSMSGILTLRFYIFYMVALSVVGSFIIGVSNSAASIAARVAILIVLGLGLTYLGVIKNASGDLDKYGNLDRLQNSRLDQTRSGSGYGSDADVSTTEGAITVIPIGFAYLMLAPFPWEVKNLRQAITLPEILLWWAMLPLLFTGMMFSIRHRLRTAMPILLFTLMLTFAYSIFQSNVGTAYRQRTQIQVFMMIFIAVGWTLRAEKVADNKLLRQQRQRQMDSGLRSQTGVSA